MIPQISFQKGPRFPSYPKWSFSISAWLPTEERRGEAIFLSFAGVLHSAKWELSKLQSPSFLPIGVSDQPKRGSFIAVLTLEGIRVSGQKVLQLVAVGVNIVDGFSFNSKLVTLLHLPGAAGGTLVLTNQQIHIWKKGQVYFYSL